MAFGIQLRLPWEASRVRDNSSIEVAGRRWPLQVVRHARARRYVLRMTGTGELRLTVPRRASVAGGLRFVQQQAAWIGREHQRRQARPNLNRPDATVFFRDVETPVAQVRAIAAVELSSRCLELAAHVGETVARVSVRNQRSRWGSCSSRRTIALNWRLVLMPSFVSDYVILHELMHLRQPNHSRAFWREVAAVCPRWRDAERWLRQHGRDLL